MRSGRSERTLRIGDITMKQVTLALALICCLEVVGAAQGPAPASTAPSPTQTAAPTVAAATITDADIKGLSGPKAEAKANGDPAGTTTGTVGDIPVGDAKKGLTIGDVVNQVGQNQIAINFVWTLIAGFLVMFMQA